MAKVKYMSKGSQQNRKSTCKLFCIFYKIYNNYFCSYKGRVLKPFPNEGLVSVCWVAVAQSKAQHRDHFVHHLSCFAFAGATCVPWNTGYGDLCRLNVISVIFWLLQVVRIFLKQDSAKWDIPWQWDHTAYDPTQNDQVDTTNFSLPVGVRTQLWNPDALTASQLSQSKVLYLLNLRRRNDMVIGTYGQRDR